MIEPLFKDSQYTQWAGDNETILKDLPEHSVDCIMTSPPYFGLRSYLALNKIFDGTNGCEHGWGEEIKTHKGHPGTKSNLVGTQTSMYSKEANHNGSFCLKCGAWRGQLGGEPQPDLYIKHLCNTFDLCKRVLKKTGVLWVNIADSRAGSGKCIGSDHGKQSQLTDADLVKTDWKTSGIQSKSMVGIPERFMLEMISRGWILRSKIIWQKNNCMPSSSNDRFTDDYEMLYMFVQSQKYYFEMQYEPMKRPEATFSPDTSNHSTLDLLEEGKRTTTGLHDGRTQYGSPGLGRHLRSVWNINTKGVKGLTHHAVFPTELCTTPIRSTCPEFVCTKCGKPRVKIYKKVSHYTQREEAHAPNSEPTKVDSTGWERPDIELVGLSDCGCDHTGTTKTGYDEGMNANRLAKLRQYAREHGEEYQNNLELVGLSDCGCSNPFRPGVVLDLFSGSGTVALEARRLARESWCIDISETYAAEAVKRVTAIENPFE